VDSRRRISDAGRQCELALGELALGELALGELALGELARS
jgi:hypothetical protein